jgi:hypothetical protein
MHRLVLLLWLWVFSPLVSADVEIVVDDEGLARYWELAPERMGTTMPPLATEVPRERVKHGGEIWFAYEVTINAQGDPEDFRFVSIEPPEADPRPFQALVMFLRYRPAEGVKPTRVRVVTRTRHWKPD